MRIFFLFLLIINLLFAAWLYTQPQKQLAEIRPLPAEIKTVELLHQSSELTDSKDDQPESEPVEGVVDDNRLQENVVHCYTLGPFSDEAKATEIKGFLSEQVSALHVRRREEREPHRYWVYLPAQANREQAIELSNELAKKKIADFYIIRGGEWNNSISLGHFKEKIHADRRLKQLSKLGFDVETEVIYRQYNLFWLDYSVGEQQALDDELIAGYLVDGVARLERSCE